MKGAVWDLMIHSYKEAQTLIEEWGILPLSSFIPEYPSLESVTPKEQWHNGQENDPWLWRDRFAAEGVAAYGRFFKKKPLLIARDWFPVVKAILGDGRSPEERYEDGELSRSALLIYRAVEEQPGIDSRALRTAAGLKDKDAKAEYDRALIELQSTCDLVIAGIADARLNPDGVKSGWNSTCYDLADRWLARHGLGEAELLHSSDAKELLNPLLRRTCSEKSYAYLQKVFSL